MSAIVSLFALSAFTLLQSGNCLEIPKWADIFSGLRPSEVNEVDNGDPRLGFVQVNSKF